MPETPLRRPVVALITALLLLTAAGCATPAPSAAPTPTAPTPPAQSAALQSAVDDFVAEHRDTVPGVIARVITPSTVWTGAAGVAARDGGVPPAANDHTRIGSVTKTMTATILLQLVEEERVSLDDAIGTYVPGIVNAGATLRQLADMTSGIPSYTLDPTWQQTAFSDPDKEWTPQELIDAANRLPASFAPGAGWEYSNSNYVLLGLVIEQVTRQPIEDVFQERLFDPLGMTSSQFPTTVDLPRPFLAGVTVQGVDGDEPVDATTRSPSFAFTAGEVVSTLDDLQTWAHALFTGEGVLQPETQQLRRASILPPSADGAPGGYGIGWGDRDGWWGHTGEIPGYTTAVFHDYDTATTILVVVNSDVASPSGESPAAGVLAALQDALG